jgi:hypothetical protein
METYDADARPGDVIGGHDGNLWRSGALARDTPLGLSVTLARDGVSVTGYPPPGTPVRIARRAKVPSGTPVEAAALQALAAFGPVSLVQETWEG